jgi:hypothetical protein
MQDTRGLEGPLLHGISRVEGPAVHTANLAVRYPAVVVQHYQHCMCTTPTHHTSHTSTNMHRRVVSCRGVVVTARGKLCMPCTGSSGTRHTMMVIMNGAARYVVHGCTRALEPVWSHQLARAAALEWQPLRELPPKLCSCPTLPLQMVQHACRNSLASPHANLCRSAGACR